MIKVLYYYYYLFYNNVYKDKEPYLTTGLALSFSLFLLILIVVDITLAFLFCIRLPMNVSIIILLLILAANFFFFLTSDKAKEILRSQPKFFNNHRASVVLTWIFFLATTSAMFWLGDVVRGTISNCK